jgi:hypothetical protein
LPSAAPSPKALDDGTIHLALLLFFPFFLIYEEQYTAEAPYREDSKLSLKRVKREQTEEEAGSHRGLCATEPPKEGSGSFFFSAGGTLRAIFFSERRYPR